MPAKPSKSKLARGPEIITLDDWRKAVKAGDTPTAGIRKSYVAQVEKAGSDDKLQLSFAISTQAVDRDQDTVAVAGWRLANFLKNPVVLWAHMYDALPVAKALSVSVTANALTSLAEFTPKELVEFGYTVYQLYLNKFLSAVSVGFIPIKYALVNDTESGRAWGYDMLEQELLEYSCVPVPANPEALIEARGMGIDCAPIAEWAEKFLQGEKGPGFWAPRDLVERSFYVITGKGESVLVSKTAKKDETPVEEPKAETAEAIEATEAAAGAAVEVVATVETHVTAAGTKTGEAAAVVVDKAGNSGGGDEPNDPEALMQDAIDTHAVMQGSHSIACGLHEAIAAHVKALKKADAGSDEHASNLAALSKAVKALAASGDVTTHLHKSLAGKLTKTAAAMKPKPAEVDENAAAGVRTAAVATGTAAVETLTLEATPTNVLDGVNEIELRTALGVTVDTLAGDEFDLAGIDFEKTLPVVSLGIDGLDEAALAALVRDTVRETLGARG